jgi:hypothetical protein
MSGPILCISEDSASRIQMRADGQTVCLSQLDVTELFAVTRQNISRHQKSPFGDDEAAEDFSAVRTVGNGQALRCAKFWNRALLRQRLPSSVGN